MPLEFQTVPVAFTKGADTKTQKKLVLPGNWVTLQNLTLSEDGTPRTRDGTAPLVAGANGNGLFQHNEQLLVASGPFASTVSLAGTDNAYVVGGKLGNVGIAKQEVRRSTGMQETPDCAYGDGLTAYVWCELSAVAATVSVNCSIVDEDTGAQVVSNQTLRTAAGVFGPRVVYAGGAFYFFYIDSSVLYCTVTATSSPSLIGTETAIVSSASLAGQNFDACAFEGPNGGAVLVAFRWGDGVSSVLAIGVDRTGTTPSLSDGPTAAFTEALLPVASITSIACEAFSSGTQAGIFVTSTGAAPYAGLAGATLTSATWTAGVNGVISPTVGATTSECHLCACQDGANLRVFRDFQSESGTAALTQIIGHVVDNNQSLVFTATNVQPTANYGGAGAALGVEGPYIHGKPFVSGGRVYLPVFVYSVWNGISGPTANPRNLNSQNTFFVLDTGPTGAAVGTGVVVAKALAGTLGLASINGNPAAVGVPCSSPAVTAGFATVAGELTQLVLSNGNNISPTGLVRLTMSPNSTLPPISAQLGESTYVAGGSLASYDGVGLMEAGFPMYPEGVQITVNGGGTGAMTAGVHQVVVVYEHVDSAGQRWQSAPSPAVQVTTVATGSLTVRVPTLLLSQRSGIQVVAYMTQASGLSFFRVLLNNGAYAPVSNTTAATFVTLTIDDSDTTIGGNELLYTQPNQAGSTLASIAPGPVDAVAVAHNRLWYAKADQSGGFGYSQQYVNNVGLQFSPELEDLLPAEAGRSVALAPLDEKVVLFTARRIFIIYGTGPAPNGGFNNYSEPQELPSDVGCSAPHSVLRMPDGLIFKSQKGWYLLGRDLQTTYIGAGVASFDAYTPTGAVLLGDRQECRFVLSDGTTLVYSYLLKQWSWTQYTNLDYQPVDAAWWPAAASGAGRYVHVSLANGLNVDTPGQYTDQVGLQAANGILTRARTGWLHLSDLEGFQRVRRLYFSATTATQPTSNLTILVDFDDAYDGVSPGSYSFSVNLFTTFFPWAGGSIDLRHKLRRQKCKSVAFTFVEGANSGNARLNGIQALALEIGVKRGVNKLPAAQSVG